MSHPERYPTGQQPFKLTAQKYVCRSLTNLEASRRRVVLVLEPCKKLLGLQEQPTLGILEIGETTTLRQETAATRKAWH